MAATDIQGNFSTAIQFWKGVGLPALQRQLDHQGLTIVENQKDGLVSRKKLAEQTRGTITQCLIRPDVDDVYVI